MSDGRPVTVSLVNLGCLKNQAAAEVMLGQLAPAGTRGLSQRRLAKALRVRLADLVE
jgi:tRNA A37 methylthiotransferase MiaB